MRLALALSVAVLVALAACAGGTRPSATATTTTTTTTTTVSNTDDDQPPPPPPPNDGPKIDGTAGAICSWGARRTDPAPKPEPCAAGLTCCYPCGVQGCDSVCTDVQGGMCPAYP